MCSFHRAFLILLPTLIVLLQPDEDAPTKAFSLQRRNHAIAVVFVYVSDELPEKLYDPDDASAEPAAVSKLKVKPDSTFSRIGMK